MTPFKLKNMKVIFLKDYNGFQKKGEILEMGEHLAKHLILQGVVKVYEEPKKVEVKEVIMPKVEVKEEKKEPEILKPKGKSKKVK